MGKKEIFLIIGLVVLSLGVGVLVGKIRSTPGKQDMATPAVVYENRGGEAPQYTANQPAIPQYDYTAEIQRILKERPNDAKAFVEVGNIYFDQHKFVGAIEYYKKAIALDPQDVNSYNDIGLSYHYIGRSDEGLKYVEEGIKKNPVYQRIWLTKGFILAINGHIPEARSAWEKAYSIDPNSDVGKSAASFLAQHLEIGK
ncbi:MAG: tetratricopeptide repeat protein [Deltaproteobacteria bacterium]|nr:tetratricopeptide repeat protein [Deltaproteobacteria bacterium]